MTAHRRDFLANWLQSWPAQYVFAIAAVIAASFARHALVVGLGLTHSLILFYPTILVVSLLCGFYPGLTATIASAVISVYFFTAPRYSFKIERLSDGIAVSLFILVGISIGWVANQTRRRAARLLEFEQAIEGLEEMIIVIDRDYRYQTANRAFLNYRGMKRGEVIGRRVNEILNPGVFESALKEKIDECFSGRTVQFEMSYRCANRGDRELLIGYFPIAGRNGIDRIACVLQDVTDRKESHRSLKLFRTLIDHSNDGVQVVDPETFYFIDVNEKACDDLGYTRPELLAMKVCDIVPAADRSSCEAVLHELKDEGALLKETVHRRKNGSEFPVEVSFKYLKLDRGYIIAVSRDISERVRTQAVLRESEDRYRDLVEHSQDLVCTHDLEGTLLSVNPEPGRTLGYAVEELLGLSMRNLIAPEFQGEFDAYLHRIREKGTDSGLLCVVTRSGERRIWEYRNTLRTEGVALPIVRGMAHDITERRRAESAQFNSEQRYRLLFEKNLAGVALADLEGKVVDCNDAWAQILGYDCAEQVRGRPTAEFYYDSASRDPLIDELKKEGAFFSREMRLRRKDGTPVWVLFNTALLSNNSGPQFMQSTFIDISKRKMAEEEMRNAKEFSDNLIQTANVIILGLDTDGNVNLFNDAGEAITGYTFTELKGKSWSVLVPRDRFPHVWAEFNSLVKERATDTFECPILTKRGEERFISWCNSTVKIKNNVVATISFGNDITEHKRAQEALRHSEDDYRTFVAQSSEGIFREELDAPIPINLPEEQMIHRILHDSYVAECNDAMARMYGFTSGQQMAGKRLTEMLLTDDPGNVQLTREYIHSGFRVLDRESHEVDVRGNPKVFRNSMIGIVEDGKLIRTWGIQRDVTEQVRLQKAHANAESALRKSEEHFRILVEQATDGIFLADAQGRYIDVNTAGTQMLGYSRDELLQLSIPDIVAETEIDRIPTEISRFAAGSVVRSDWTLRRKDGSLFPGEICGKKLPDGRLQGILRDVTERKKAEEDLRRSEERFRVALKDSPITVFNQDRDLRYTWIYNPQLYWQHDVLGKTDEEIVGSKKAASLTNVKRRVLSSGLPLREETVIPNNGNRLVFDVSVEPLFDASGKVIGITGACVDIAKLREMADRLQDSRDRLARQKSYLEKEIRTELGFADILGRSPALEEVLKKTRVVAPTDSTVLLLGETGTGKELVARSVHALSSRHGKTFVKLNCAAVPSGLLESELFGHEKGAFTGAVSQKVGRIELADKGTLFLDEIGELPPELQPKLLRVLQDREFERLGGVHTLRVDVRIISATNRDLHQDVTEKKFREDLYYRLNVFPIQLPPLRDRKGDIPILVRHFVHKHSLRMGKQIDSIHDETMRTLQNWNWPGNVRELENMIERMIILSKDGVLAGVPSELEHVVDTAPDDLSEMEREHIIRVLRQTHGVLSGADGAAVRLGLKRTTLQSMLKRFGIEADQFREGNEIVGES